jgi:hypothetical protein
MHSDTHDLLQSGIRATERRVLFVQVARRKKGWTFPSMREV